MRTTKRDGVEELCELVAEVAALGEAYGRGQVRLGRAFKAVNGRGGRPLSPTVGHACWAEVEVLRARATRAEADEPGKSLALSAARRLKGGLGSPGPGRPTKPQASREQQLAARTAVGAPYPYAVDPNQASAEDQRIQERAQRARKHETAAELAARWRARLTGVGGVEGAVDADAETPASA